MPQVVGGLRRRTAAHVPLGKPRLERGRVDRRHVGVEQPRAVQLAEDRGDAAGAVDVLHVVHAAVGRVGRDLRKAGHATRDGVDLIEAEVNPGLVSRGQQVEDRVGRSAHGDVEGHRVGEGGGARDRTREYRGVVLVVERARDLHRDLAGLLVEGATGRVRREHRSVAGEGQAEGLDQAVHRVGREHARA